jgi:hypothetical protein
MAGSLFYGFGYFCLAVESQTVIFTMPVSILIPVAIFILSGYGKFKIRHPIAMFYLIAYLTAFTLFICWAIMNDMRLPQFSELGWI